jgi:hypothetical protein
MAKLQDFYLFLADFRFKTCKNENRTVVYVGEYATIYNVLVKRLSWVPLSETISLTIKKKSAKKSSVLNIDNIKAAIQEYIDNHNL